MRNIMQQINEARPRCALLLQRLLAAVHQNMEKYQQQWQEKSATEKTHEQHK